MEALPKDERVILVGHSFDGVSITLAMERFPEKISAAVFAAASMPGPNLPMSSIRAQYPIDMQFTFDEGPNNPPTSFLITPDCLASRFFQLSPPEDLALAEMLVRPRPVMEEAMRVSEENYGRVAKVYIVCDQDLVVRENVQRWMIQNNPTDQVMLISGSDHMLMFSKPLDLCSCLLDIANTYT